MPNYRLVKNGYVAADVSDGEAASIFKNIKFLRTDAYADFSLVIKGHVAVETLLNCKRLVGASFHDFLEVNFQGGRGPLAPLVRTLVHYLNDKVGYFSVLTQIQEYENKLHALTRRRSGTYVPSISAGHSEVFLKNGDTVIDYDFYRLLAALGPAAMGRLMLLLGGEEYYV